MAIALDGTPQGTSLGSAGTSITVNVPPGIPDGDVLILSMDANVATVAPTPAGWNVVKTGTTTVTNVSVFYRVAASEPASYTPTGLSSAKWNALILAYSGVDNTTPLDIAAGSLPAMTPGTTAIAFPAITPVTSGAWIIAVGHAHGNTGITYVFSNGNMDALDKQQASNTAISPTIMTGHELWTSGAFTPTATFTGASNRTLGMDFALRPAAAVATAPPLVPPTRRLLHLLVR